MSMFRKGVGGFEATSKGQANSKETRRHVFHSVLPWDISRAYYQCLISPLDFFPLIHCFQKIFYKNRQSFPRITLLVLITAKAVPLKLQIQKPFQALLSTVSTRLLLSFAKFSLREKS